MSAAGLHTGVRTLDAARWVNPPPLTEALPLGFGVKLVRIAAASPAAISWEANVPAGPDHVLIWRDGPRAPVEAVIDGRRDMTAARGRNGYLVPAGAPSRWLARDVRPGTSLQLHIPPAWLRELGGDGSAQPSFGLEPERFAALFGGLAGAWVRGTTPARSRLEHWAVLLGIATLREAPRRHAPLDSVALARSVAFLRDNLHRDIGLSDLAALAGMPLRPYVAAFRAATGEVPAACLARLRLERARVLLRDGRLGLADVALMSGFRSAAHLAGTLRRAGWDAAR